MTPCATLRWSRSLVLVVSMIVVTVMLSGCSLRERVCSKGEHPVKSIVAPDTGRACVRDGEPPPKGYEEYPPGQAPTYLDEDKGY